MRGLSVVSKLFPPRVLMPRQRYSNDAMSNEAIKALELQIEKGKELLQPSFLKKAEKWLGSISVAKKLDWDIRFSEMSRDALQSSKDSDINQASFLSAIVRFGLDIPARTEIGTIFNHSKQTTMKNPVLKQMYKTFESTEDILKIICKNVQDLNLLMILPPGTDPILTTRAKEFIHIANSQGSKLDLGLLVSACNEYSIQNTGKPTDRILEILKIQLRDFLKLPPIRIYVSQIHNVEKTHAIIESLFKIKELKDQNVTISLGDTYGRLTPKQLSDILNNPFLTPENTILHLHNGDHTLENLVEYFQEEFYQVDANIIPLGSANPLGGISDKKGQNVSLIQIAYIAKALGLTIQGQSPEIIAARALQTQSQLLSRLIDEPLSEVEIERIIEAIQRK